MSTETAKDKLEKYIEENTVGPLQESLLAALQELIVNAVYFEKELIERDNRITRAMQCLTSKGVLVSKFS